MDYGFLMIGASCFLLVLMVLFAWEEWAKDRNDEATSALVVELAPAAKFSPDANSADKWTRLREIMDQGRLNSGDEDVREVIRKIKLERPDGWFAKRFPDV